MTSPERIINGITASDVGLDRQHQVPIVLKAIESKGGVAQMPDIYQAIEKQIGQPLSEQGRASLREVVNRYMVGMKLVRKDHGWHITPTGRQALIKDIIGTNTQVMVRSPEPPVDIETFNGTDEQVDSLIHDQRLRIGCIETRDEIALSRRRQGQQRLRELTLLNYSSMCALCDVNDLPLLEASHIVGWAEDRETQGLLSNIICLCGFHHILFDKGYLSFADDLAVLKTKDLTSRTIMILLDGIDGFRKPSDYLPNPEFLRRHRIRCGFEK